MQLIALLALAASAACGFVIYGDKRATTEDRFLGGMVIVASLIAIGARLGVSQL